MELQNLVEPHIGFGLPFNPTVQSITEFGVLSLFQHICNKTVTERLESRTLWRLKRGIVYTVYLYKYTVYSTLAYIFRLFTGIKIRH